jgi:antitoxin FitA
MSMLTVRNLDDAVKARLRVQAAEHGWAMEEEVRRILTRATLGTADTPALGSRISARFKSLDSSKAAGGAAITPPVRRLPRTAPQF